LAIWPTDSADDATLATLGAEAAAVVVGDDEPCVSATAPAPTPPPASAATVAATARRFLFLAMLSFLLGCRASRRPAGAVLMLSGT
jgi:hypothetical protein